jgi:hypothetical protein
MDELHQHPSQLPPHEAHPNGAGMMSDHMARGGMVSPSMAPDGALHPAAAGVAQPSAAGMVHPGVGGMSHPAHGLEQQVRQRVGLPPSVWAAVDAAVRHQLRESRLHTKFLSQVFVGPNVQTVPADVVIQPTNPNGVAYALTNDETTSVFVIDVSTRGALTQSHMHEAAVVHEAHNQHHLSHGSHSQHPQHHHQAHTPASTFVTIARQVAKYHATAEDQTLMLGSSLVTNPLITVGVPGPATNPNSVISVRKVPQDLGLLNLPQPNSALPPLGLLPQNQIIDVSPVWQNGPYRDNALDAIVAAVGQLVDNLMTGPYVGVADYFAYADTFKSIPGTYIYAAQGIKELLTTGWHPTGLLPRGSAANPAAPFPSTSSGGITTVSVLTGGSAYSAAPTVSFTGVGVVGSGVGGTGAGANGAVPAANIVGGALNGIFAVANGGSGYTAAQPAPVIFTGGGGSGAAGTATIAGGSVTNVTITSGGSGYTSAPTVWIGLNAEATLSSSGSVAAVTVVNPGSGFTAAPGVTINPAAGDTTGNGATAVVPQVLYYGFVLDVSPSNMDVVRAKMNGDDDFVLRPTSQDAQGNQLFEIVSRVAFRPKNAGAFVQIRWLSA